jgi:hypothetical protein
MKRVHWSLLLLLGLLVGLLVGWYIHSRSLAPTERLLRYWVELGKANEGTFNNLDQTIVPLVLYETNSGTLFYVESDGRHISAFGSNGKVLWTRNPFVDSGLQPYRYKKPVISRIEFQSAPPQFLRVIFNSTQFGNLDPKTGDFDFRGQD